MAIQRHLHGKKERSGTQPFMFHYRLFHYRLFSTLFDPHACAADGRQQNARARRASCLNSSAQNYATSAVSTHVASH